MNPLSRVVVVVGTVSLHQAMEHHCVSCLSKGNSSPRLVPVGTLVNRALESPHSQAVGKERVTGYPRISGPGRKQTYSGDTMSSVWGLDSLTLESGPQEAFL